MMIWQRKLDTDQVGSRCDTAESRHGTAGSDRRYARSMGAGLDTEPPEVVGVGIVLRVSLEARPRSFTLLDELIDSPPIELASGILIENACKSRPPRFGSKTRVQNVEAIVDEADGNATPIETAF
jgi:hypothetical protein